MSPGEVEHPRPDPSPIGSPLGDNPFSPAGPFFRPPPLSILHLLALTAVAAVMFKLGVVFRAQGPSYENLLTYLRIFRDFWTLLGQVTLAAVVVGAGILAVGKLRGAPGRLQPGHWLCAILCISNVFYILLSMGWFVVAWSGLVRENQGQIQLLTFVGILSLPRLISAVLFFIAARRLRVCRGWRNCMILLGSCNAAQCLLYWIGGWTMANHLDSRLFTAAHWPLWSVVPGLVVGAVAMVDLAGQHRRDWLHWLGVACTLLLALTSMLGWLWIKLVAQTLSSL